MRIQRKVVNQLLLTSSEVSSLVQLIEEAKQGKTVHYSEKRMDNGSFFGIGVDMPEQYESPIRPYPTEKY